MTTPTEADLNALDVTPAEAAEINAIAHPLLAGAAPDADDQLVQIRSTPDGVVFVTIKRPDKRNAFDAATVAALYEAFETLQGADHVRVVFVASSASSSACEYPVSQRITSSTSARPRPFFSALAT